MLWDIQETREKICRRQIYTLALTHTMKPVLQTYATGLSPFDLSIQIFNSYKELETNYCQLHCILRKYHDGYTRACVILWSITSCRFRIYSFDVNNKSETEFWTKFSHLIVHVNTLFVLDFSKLRWLNFKCDSLYLNISYDINKTSISYKTVHMTCAASCGIKYSSDW